MSWVPLFAAFGLIFLAELPDKTMMATLVLSSRYKPIPVLLGVSAAFVVQTAIAVAAGGLLGLLPSWVVLSIVALLFAVGAVLLFRESLASDDDDETGNGRNGLSFWPTVFTSFGVLFAAEWGDASQLGTAALSAHYSAPWEVFTGAALGLITVAALAVVLGRVVVRYVPLKWIQRGAAILFGVFAVIAVVELIRGLGHHCPGMVGGTYGTGRARNARKYRLTGGKAINVTATIEAMPTANPLPIAESTSHIGKCSFRSTSLPLYPSVRDWAAACAKMVRKNSTYPLQHRCQAIAIPPAIHTAIRPPLAPRNANATPPAAIRLSSMLTTTIAIRNPFHTASDCCASLSAAASGGSIPVRVL
ncbi:TMEM165/GDT1 family protein [Stackebrandtia nassauensis]|uniref:GDT1 family protein n=1 Tax=Stackebrandtia nassauensis (strain DSM 44728 / CIP 108903 / NRRL B-16338 / NBRC 102104 / LLR-40K-21) TaxID=446470 RepID=D3Q5L4_STANL|nr:TMEM165/GDT1 family protein [Stackebrandtia nassauensis]ADD46074.1 protein of unknown function UPF0016 [Stackebrandtia nassauensis DSM 44728]